MESKKGSTSNTYACVFTSDRLVSVWVYHLNKFWPIRQRIPNPTAAAKLIPCDRGMANVGVLKYCFDRKLPSGHDCYVFSKLYLKY